MFSLKKSLPRTNKGHTYSSKVLNNIKLSEPENVENLKNHREKMSMSFYACPKSCVHQ